MGLACLLAACSDEAAEHLAALEQREVVDAVPICITHHDKSLWQFYFRLAFGVLFFLSLILLTLLFGMYLRASLDHGHSASAC